MYHEWDQNLHTDWQGVNGYTMRPWTSTPNDALCNATWIKSLTPQPQPWAQPCHTWSSTPSSGMDACQGIPSIQQLKSAKSVRQLYQQCMLPCLLYCTHVLLQGHTAPVALANTVILPGVHTAPD